MSNAKVSNSNPNTANISQPNKSKFAGAIEVANVAKNAGNDGKISRKEADALISHDYGKYLPKFKESELTEKNLRAKGYVGKHTDGLRNYLNKELPTLGVFVSKPVVSKVLQSAIDAEVTRMKHISNRNLAQKGMFFFDGKSTEPPQDVPQGRRDSFQELVDIFHERNKSSNKLYGLTMAHDGTSLVTSRETDIKTGGDTVVHEAIHQYSHQNVNEQLPDVLIEGMTEYLAQQTLKRNGNMHGTRQKFDKNHASYNYQSAIAHQLSGKVGDEVIKDAYFKGNVSGLGQAFENVIGEGSWNIYLNILTLEPSKAAPLVGNLMRSNSKSKAEFTAPDPGLQEWRNLNEEASKIKPVGIDES